MTIDYQSELKKISQKEIEIQPILLGALLAKLYADRGVDFTIVGGAAVQFYTQANYTTSDLDVILEGDTSKIIDETMTRLGFKRTTTYRHFEHPLLGFVVEFPPSPIAVGGRDIFTVDEIKTEYGPVRIIRIEDLIMDRIIAGVEWQQEPSIEQAKLMWIKYKDKIDLNYLTDFAKSEGYLKTLKEVMAPIKKKKS